MLELIPFTCGWLQVPLNFFLGGADNSIFRAPVPAYLIKHPAGLALFDTGLGLRFRREADFRLGRDEPGCEFDESADIAMRLRAIDIDPASIKWIINSHFHTDHCGGNASIPNATIIVQSRELAGAKAHADGVLYDPVDYDTGHPILAIDGEHDLYGDGSVMIFPSYGHTAGHQSARIALPTGPVVLTGDCCYLKRSLDEMLLPAHNHSLEASMATLRRLRAMRDQGARILYGHDPILWETLPQGLPIT
jgi:N-acyl homoserine lactone hydrolase